MAFALPVGGVYASADSPSKYLDRLTTVNTSMNRESNDASPGVEDEPTVSHAVKTSHGVILNTVVRNANRLEYVNDSPVTIEGNDDGTDLIGEKAVAWNTGTSDSNEHTVNLANTNASGDGQSRGIEWPEGGFTGESTITYDANGKGSFEGGAATNVVTTKYDGYKKVTKYTHTDNVDDAGVQNGGYGNNKSFSRVVTIPGASSLTVNLTYQTEGTNWDWVCAYAGANAGNINCSASLTGKLGGKTKTTKSFTVDGDSVTFWFRSDGGGSNFYGYYAVVKGLVGSKESVSGTYAAPVDTSGEYKLSSWNTKPDGTGENLGAGEVYSPSNQTVYAQWELGSNYTKWGTVGWRITDDGVLKIRPWEGDTGTTGSATSYYDVPWYWQASKIKKVESTGTIVLNANSVGLFYNCSNLTDITGLASWNVSNVTDMWSMFRGCSNLAGLSPLALWDVSNVTNMSGMFQKCSSLTDLTPLKSWNVSNVTSISEMFRGCSSLTDLTPLAHWNVSNVTSMYYMFENCSKLTDLTALANWNVSKVTDMGAMFYGCSSLTDLTALAHWNVSKVTNMRSMFYGCSSLTNLTPLAHWNVSNVWNMSFMFYKCSSLTDLTGLEHWDVSKVTNMSSMFNSCSSLTDLTPLKSWNVSNVTSMSNMFYQCSKLTNLTPLKDWIVSKVWNMESMFSKCSNLTDLTALASWNVSKVTNMNSMFSNCSRLQKVGIPSIANGGQKLVANASTNGLSGSLGSRIITEDLQLGPYTWDELNTEMTKNPEGFTEGHVWVRYTPSWMVTYNTNGGVGSQAGSMMPLSESLTLPESQFLRFGYRFIGWTAQPGSVSDVNPLLKPGETYKPVNVIEGQKYPLYAQWEKIGGEEEQLVTGQSGSLPGWVQVDSENTRNDIIPNQSQSVVFTNKYDPGLTSIQFKFTKLMDGNVPDVGNSFQFELVSVSENKVIQTTVNNGASVQFNPITYDNPGEYVYYVRESPSITQDNVNANPSIDYDDHLVEIKVTVTEADDASSPSGKKLTAVAQVTGDTTFRNDSKPASLDITKTVTGVTEGMSETHKDREFTFNVNLLDRDNQPVSGKTYPITTTSDNGESNGDAASSTGSITFDNFGNATVKLKAGSKLTINGIPAYYKYVITETNIPAGYDNTSLTNPSGVLGANSHVTVDAVNHYTVTPASVSLQAGKTLLAPGGLNQSVNNGEFRFTLCQVVASSNESEPNVESCSGVSETSNDGNGLVTFPQLAYDSPGTYQYQIREVKGNALDMAYDSTVYTVTVNVTDDGEGRLVAKVTYRNNTTGVESSPGSSSVWDPSDPGSMGVPVFVNRTTVANRLPVTGGSDVIIASVILALVLAGGLFVFLRRDREE